MEYTTYILRHEICYWYENTDMPELPDSEEEHIKRMIIDGYHSGELCYDDVDEGITHYGWWKIV